jgi:ABC-2 type transport system permease protein
MKPALLWLVVRSTRNRMARRLARLREPRYALAMLVGLAYFWLIFLRPGRPTPLTGTTPGSGTHLAYAFAIALLVASWWLAGGDKVALTFSPAEVTLLFPAPVTRRELVQLKLLQAQAFVLVSTVIWALLLGRDTGSVWLRAAGLWVFFSTLYLHRLGASLVRATAAEHGVAGVRRQRWALAVFGIAAAAVLWSVVRALPALQAAVPRHALGDALGELLRTPPLSVVLFPFQLLLAPVFAATPREWVRAIGPALLLMVAHYPWILRSDLAFEESAAEAAAKRAAALSNAPARGVRIRAPRRGVLRGRLALPPTGRPAVAIVWKNAIALARTIPMATVVGVMIMAVLVAVMTFAVMPPGWSAASVIGTACLIFAGLLVIMGPLWVRNDLRFDLLRLEMLRSYPLSGRSIVRAEIAASVATLSAAQVVLLLVGYLLVPPGAYAGSTLGDRTALLVAALVVLPVVNAAGLAIQNAATLLFPAWTRLGLVRAGGIEAMGQSIVTTLGTLVVLLAVLAIPGVVGGALAVLGVGAAGFWGAVPGAVVGAAGVLVELWALTTWLGRVFERTEPSVLDFAAH